MYINDQKLRNGEDVAGSHPISVKMGDLIFMDQQSSYSVFLWMLSRFLVIYNFNLALYSTCRIDIVLDD
jgi:hypothetical protein